jgi:hypothetical protein
MVQHARQVRKDEAAFYEYWERRQEERERLKEERNEPAVASRPGPSKTRSPQQGR